MTSFYKLTNEEWLRAVHALTESQKDLLLYLRTLDPFGDRELDLGVRELARILGCNASTISRALTVLKEKGYIDLEMVRVRVKIKDSCKDREVLRPCNSVASEQHLRSPRNDRGTETTDDAQKQHLRSPRNDRDAEPLPAETSRSPHTIQTNQTNKTLSDSQTPAKNRERDADLFDQDGEPIEPYKAWLIRKADKLPNPIGIIELWLEKNARKPALIRAYRQIESQSSAPPPPQDNLNSVIAGIDAELARLSWSRDQAIAHMVECFEWRKIAFDRIVDDDLLALLNELEQMESEGDV